MTKRYKTEAERNAETLGYLIAGVLLLAVLAAVIYLIVMSAALAAAAGGIAGAFIAVRNYFRALYQNVNEVQI